MTYIWNQGVLPWEMVFKSHITPQCHFFASALCQSPTAPTKKSEWGQWSSFKDGVTAEQNEQSSHTSHVLYASPPPVTKLQLGKHTCGLTTPTLPLQLLGTQSSFWDKDSFKGICNVFSEDPAARAVETMRALITKFSSAVPIKKQALVLQSFSGWSYRKVSPYVTGGKNSKSVDQCVTEITEDHQIF